MSILVVDGPVYDRVAYKMLVASNRTVVDENYYGCCRDLSAEEIDSYVNCWYQLNVRSWCARYAEIAIITKRSWRFARYNKTSAIQFLKWLDAISYNIEISTIEMEGTVVSPTDKRAVDFLNRLIAETLRAIVGSSKEYSIAAWCDLPG